MDFKLSSINDEPSSVTDTIHDLKLWLLAVSVALVASIGLNVYGLTTALNASHDASTLATRTCTVQGAALKAHESLNATIADIYKLLSIPPTKAQVDAERRQPLWRIVKTQEIIHDLDKNSHEYVKIQESLPKGRTC